MSAQVQSPRKTVRDIAAAKGGVRPGDVVRMPVRVVRHRGDVFKFAGQAMVGDKVAAECEFAAMVVET